MCGICGIFSKEILEDGEERISNMVTALLHRGPDGHGFVHPSISPNIFLGHTRLAIISPTEDSAQPMVSAENGNVIVFNGEVYNYRELRSELISRGVQFKTQSDTEVVLSAYSVWGNECVSHFRGIFAFAIWDSSKKTLFAARDPLGVKPFYYFANSTKIVFASEVRTLLASGLVPRELSPEGIDSLIAFGSLQEPFTMISNVFSLPAASVLEIKEDGKSSISKYWQPSFSKCELADEDIDDFITQSLNAAVNLQMVSDVPIGVFLSGGIDSTTLASLMSKDNREVHSFTVVFEDASLDEGAQAAETAKRLHTVHHELLLTEQFISSTIEKALDDYDQPGIDGLNTWYVSRLTHDAGIKVALSGLGGDELFAGYGEFYRPRRLMRLAQIIHLLPKCLCSIGSRCASSEGMRKLFDTGLFPYSPYFLTRQIMSATTRSSLLVSGSSLAPSWMQESFAGLHTTDDTINLISWLELSTYMRSTLLRDADQMGMANAMEIRVPLIDQVLVEMMLNIPGARKLRKGLAKPLLVKAANIPRETATSPKRGFNMPIAQIIKQNCQYEAHELFMAPTTDLFRKGALKKFWEDFENGRVAWQRIWPIFVALRWIKMHRCS